MRKDKKDLEKLTERRNFVPAYMASGGGVLLPPPDSPECSSIPGNPFFTVFQKHAFGISSPLGLVSDIKGTEFILNNKHLMHLFSMIYTILQA